MPQQYTKLKFGAKKKPTSKPRWALSLSHTENGWEQGSNTVYSVIHGLTGMIIEL